MPNVSISNYWNSRLEAWIQRGNRKSKAEIVEEGLKLVAPRIEREIDEWEDYQQRKKEEA